MAQLLVRNLDDDLVNALKVRAARRGRSAEAEHREILRRALSPVPGPPSMKEMLSSVPCVGADTDFRRIPMAASP